MPKTMTSGDIATLLNADLEGDPAICIGGVASLAEAAGSDVAFLGNPKYRSQVLPSAAPVILVPEDFDLECPPGKAWIRCKDPSSAFQKLVMAFAPPPPEFPVGVHHAAVLGAGVQVSPTAHIGAHAFIGPRTVIGDNSVVAAGAYVGEDVRIGMDCIIYPNVTIRERCVIADRVIIHPSSVIGADGFGFELGPTGHTKIPQVGIVQIDSDVEIGSNVCIDRARFGRTWIQTGVKIDNLVQIAHNVVIKPHAVIVAQVGISGSSEIGVGAVLAGKSGVSGHVKVGDGSVVMGFAGVTKDIGPKSVVIGMPAMDRKAYVKQQLKIRSVDKLTASVKELKRQLAELQTRLDALSDG